jgi:Mn-dependent DtxR family transcriptional regulator
VDRLPAILDRPMRGAELAARLGVTPQRIHQIVVRLLACDAVRIGDSAHILHIVARTDDPSVLLTRDDERVLSALPEAATTASAIASVTHMPVARVQDGLARLCELHLVNNAETRRGRALYRLSPAGNAHFQRRRGMQRAKPALLVVKSDRVRDVLSYLSGQGPARTRDVRDALGIALPSINALMQYLKRRGLVKKAADKLNAPYALTEAGRAALAEMIRRAA